MEKNIYDNLTYLAVENELRNHKIFEYAYNTAESKVLEAGGKKDQELYYKNYQEWKEKHKDDISAALKEIDGNAIPQIRAKSIQNAITNAENSFIITGARRERESQYKDIDTEELVGIIGLEDFENIAKVERPSAGVQRPTVDSSGSGTVASESDTNSLNPEAAESSANATNSSAESNIEIAESAASSQKKPTVSDKDQANEDISDLAPETASETIEAAQGGTASSETEAVSNKHAKTTAEASNEPNAEIQTAETPNEPISNTITTRHGDIVKSEAQLNYQPTNWRVSQSDADMVAGVQNAIDKGKFVAWDTETLGGLDEFGKQRYDAVTEFTFKLKEYDAEAKTISSFGSAVGLTDEQYAFGEQVWKKVRAGAKLTGQEEVWAHRLALIGESKYEQAKNKEKGVFEYTHFADKDEILKLNPDEIKTGLEKAYAMGKEQRNAGLIKYDGEKMYAWESELFKGIDTIINGDLTAVGHNTVNFDRKALQWLLQHGMWSEGAKKIAEKRLENLTSKNGDLHFNHEFDTMAAQNQHAESRLDNYITTDENGKTVVNEEALEFAKRRKLSAGQQEAIGYSLYKDMYEGADVNAHTSDVDVDVVGKIFTSPKYSLDAENSFLKGAKDTKSYVIKGDGSQLFHMTRSHTAGDLSKNGMFGFVTGEVRNSFTTFSGVEHGEDGARKLIFKPGALQKGVSYSISNVTALSVSKELQTHIARIQPDADLKNLIAVTLNPEFHEDVNPGYTANRSVTIVGSRFNVESLLNESALLYATKDEKGEYIFTDDEKTKKALMIRQIDENGRMAGARAATVEDLLKESSEKLRDSSALRVNRERDFKKDMGLLQYIEDMRSWGAENGTDNLENRFMEQVSSGNTKRSFADYFGYIDDRNIKVVENPTVATAMNRIDYVVKNEKTIRDAAQRALNSAGTNQTIDDILASDISHGVDKNASYYYKAYMTAVNDAAMQQVVSGNKANVGLINDGSHVYELNNIEVDMNGFGERYDFTEPFRINLNAGGKTNFRNLAHYLSSRPDMGEDEAVALLAKFQDFLVKSPTLGNFGKDAIRQIRKEQGKNGAFRINGNNNIDFAFAKIAHSLSAAKKKYPASGILTPTEKYNLAAHKEEFGITDAERKEILDNAEKTTLRPIKVSRESDTIFAEEATNKILYGGLTDIDEVKQQFMDYGYSEHDALKAAYIRDQQRRDTKNALERIAGAVRRNGGNMGIDVESGSIFVEANGKRTVLDRMLKNVMENGISYIESGNMRFHAPVGLYATNIYRYKNGLADNLNYKFISKIGAEFENMGYYHTSFKRAAKNGQLGEEVQRFVSSWGHNVSQAASVLAEDFQEMRMGGDVDISGILPLIARDDIWYRVSSKIDFDDPYKGEANRALRDAVEKIQESNGKGVANRYLPGDYKEFSTDVGITTAIRDIMPELHNYLDTGSQNIMRKVLGDNYQDYSLSPKAAGKGMINAYNDMHQFGDDLTSTKRGAPDFSGRVEKFYTDGVALDGEIEGIDFGHVINTAVGRSYEKDAGKGVSRSVDDIIRTGRVRMTTGTIKHIAANAELSEQATDMLFGTHLTEGAGIMDPRLVDAFFNYNKATQRVRQGKVLEIINNELDHIDEKNKMAAKIKINSDGTIDFKYSKGLYVQTEELGGKAPFTIKGIGETGSPVEIKEEGLMRMGFFSRKNNLLVSEEDIRKVLNQQNNAERIFRAADQATEAYNILNEYFEAFYYNTGVDAKSNLKMEEYWEKGMHNALFGYLGKGGRTAAEKAEDEQMAKALEKLGIQELQEFIPQKDLIESLKSDNIANTAFGAYLEGKTQKTWTHDKIVKKMAEGMRDAGANVSDAEAGKRLYDIAVRERYSPWDEVKGVIVKAVGLSDEEARKFHSITNTISNGVTKHEDLARNVAVNLLDRFQSEGKTAEEAVETVANVMQKAVPGLQISPNKNGEKVIVGDPEHVNLTELEKIAKDYNLEDSRVFWTGNGRTYNKQEFDALSDPEKQGLVKHGASFSIAEEARASDYDRLRDSSLDNGKLWKYDYRSMAMSDVDRYTEKHKADIRSGLIESLGEEKGEETYNKYFADAKIGTRTGEGFFQEFERSRWYTPGTKKDNKRVLIHGDLDQALLTDAEREEIEEAKKYLEKVGIDRDFTKSVIKRAREGYKNGTEYVEGSGADYVSVGKVKSYFSAHQHMLADNFNKGIKTREQIIKEGFGNQVISIEDLFTARSNFEKVDDHLYGKSAFLDLQINGGKGKQIYEDESQRFIAIPWTDQNLNPKDGEVLKNQYQIIATKMQNALERLQSGTDENGTPLKDDQKQKYYNILSGYADEMKQAVVYNALDKEGIVHRQMGTSEIGMSYFGKAYGHELWGMEKGFWGNISFDGENVAEMYRKNAIIDYQAASLAIRNRFFDENYFKQLGLDEDALKTFKEGFYEKLKTSGTLSTNTRNPQGYDKSTSAAAMYFSDTVTGNNLQVSAAMWESKKGDYDSDEGIAHVLTGDAVITKDGKNTVAKIDYATYEQLQEMAKTGVGGIEGVTLSSHTKRMFEDAKKQILSQAVTRNRLADENVREKNKGTGNATTEVKPEYEYVTGDNAYMGKQALEGEGEYYSGNKTLINGAKYHKLDSDERTLLRSQYEGFMEQAQNWKGLTKEDFEALSPEKQRNLYTGYVDSKFGVKSDKGKSAMNALGFIFKERDEIQNAFARKRNAAAGQMNNVVFRLFQVADASGQFLENDSIRGIAAIHTAFNEAFLTPKNESKITGIKNIENLRAAANEVYNVMKESHPSMERLAEADKKLEDIAFEVLKDRDFKELRRYVPGFDKEMGKFDKEKNEYTEEQIKFARNYIHETIGSIAQKVNASGFDMQAFDIGMKDGRKYTNSSQYAYGGMKNPSMTDINMQDIAAIGNNYVEGTEILKENAPMGARVDNQKTVTAGENFEQNMREYEQAFKDSGGSNPLRDSSHTPPPSLGELGRGATRALSNIKISGSGAAKMAAAVVGGLMASGYAGGVNTKSPQSATTQAAGANEALQEQQVPQLSDSNVNVLRGGPQSGYVINISASSPQGSDAARDAITQALGSSVPINTSMNINMSTNYQDQVNQLQISRMLENMI